jgi:hypothetical protein
MIPNNIYTNDNKPNLHLTTGWLIRDALALIGRQFIVATVVELGRLRRLVAGHPLGFFQRPAVAQVIGNAGRPEAVAADGRVDARLSFYCIKWGLRRKSFYSIRL